MDKKSFKNMKWWKKTGMINQLCKQSTSWVSDYSDQEQFYNNASARDLFNSIYFRDNRSGLDVLRAILRHVFESENYTGDIRNALILISNKNTSNSDLKKIFENFGGKKRIGFYSGPIDRLIYVSTSVLINQSDYKSVLLIFHYLNGVIENSSTLSMVDIETIIRNTINKADWNTIVEESNSIAGL